METIEVGTFLAITDEEDLKMCSGSCGIAAAVQERLASQLVNELVKQGRGLKFKRSKFGPNHDDPYGRHVTYSVRARFVTPD